MLDIEDINSVEELALSVLDKYRSKLEEKQEMTEEVSLIFAQAEMIIKNRRDTVKKSFNRVGFGTMRGVKMWDRRVMGLVGRCG